MDKYRVETSYKRLLTTYYISHHNYNNYDVIYEDDPEEVSAAITDTQLIEEYIVYAVALSCISFVYNAQHFD